AHIGDQSDDDTDSCPEREQTNDFLAGHCQAPNKSAPRALILPSLIADDDFIPRCCLPGQSWGRGEARPRMNRRVSCHFGGRLIGGLPPTDKTVAVVR